MPDRSIRNVEINHRHTDHAEVPRPRRSAKRGRSRLWVVALVVIVVAAILGVLLSVLFAGASVAITPRTAAVTLPQTIQAAINAPAGTLSYTEASAMQAATTTVAAKGTQQVSKSASGIITVQNSFSTSPQALIANTRFQAPDGKIYRIHDTVSVPGMQGTEPGTVAVTAYADSPGPDYNRSGSTIYTIPGFKGKPQYAKITAVSGPMTGGFVGTQPAVAAADLTLAKQKLQSQLDAAVRQSLNAQIPVGSELIGGTLSVSFGDLVQTDAGNGQAALSETATATGDLVRVADLAAAVATQTVQNYSGEAVSFADPSAVALTASTTPNASSLTVQLPQTQATLVWQLDPNALKNALIGQPKAKFEAIIKGFEPAVAKADASIRPFWTSTFPGDPGKITVTVQDAQ